jgi:hypothetical protein
MEAIGKRCGRRAKGDEDMEEWKNNGEENVLT